jgi:hypothetical protein
MCGDRTQAASLKYKDVTSTLQHKHSYGTILALKVQVRKLSLEVRCCHVSPIKEYFT